jgi:hypothetical protein
MVNVLSIDVGIKHLALCLWVQREEGEEQTRPTFCVEEWDVLNVAISEQDVPTCQETKKTSGLGLSMVCGVQAVYKSIDSHFYCLKHAKKQCLHMPIKENITKMSVAGLYELAEKYKIEYEKPIKKSDLVHLIQEYSKTRCFQSVHQVSSSKVDLIHIGKNIKHKLDTFMEKLQTKNIKIDKVIIENQISPIANRMKTIQGMIAQYFIMKNSQQEIEFVSSVNKLKGFLEKDQSKNEKKMTYNERKKKGVELTLAILKDEKHAYLQRWVSGFESSRKKDDLADSFLQGWWYIHNNLFVKILN